MHICILYIDNIHGPNVKLQSTSCSVLSLKLSTIASTSTTITAVRNKRWKNNMQVHALLLMGTERGADAAERL